MVIKKLCATVALLPLATMAALPMAAGQTVRKAEPLKIQGPVYLTAGPADFFGEDGTPLTLVIANNTRSTIPGGTTIYWSIKHRKPSNPSSWMETKGSFELSPQSGLWRTGQLDRRWPIPAVQGPYTTKAWYLPWTVRK